MNDLGELMYFLGLEVIRTVEGLFVSQNKYVQDLIKETAQISAKPLKLPMDPHLKLVQDQGPSLEDGNKFRRLIGKLIYLTIIRPNISYTVQALTQFM